MARRSEHSQEEIKEMVVNAAETIVMEEGFAELKVRKVAMEIGYTVGSIYMVFDNMAGLIMHVKGRTLDEITEQLNKIILDEESPEITIEKLAKCYFTFAHNEYNRWSMIFEHRLAENEVVPDWYQKKIDDIFHLIELQFQRLSSSHSEAQGKQAARVLWSGVHGICTLSLAGKMDLLGSHNMQETIVLLVQTFIKGWKS